MGRKLKLGIFILAYLISVFLLSILDSDLNVIVPSAKQAIGVLLLCGILFSIIAFSCSKGLRFLFFLAVPMLIFILITEYGFRFWIKNFADQSVKAIYLPLFNPPEDLGENSLFVPHHYTLYNYMRPYDSKNLGHRKHYIM